LKPPVFSFGRKDGQAVILVVVAMSLLLIGALGLAIDGGQMYAQRQMAQAAADAAVQAGIMSIFRGTNATSANPFGTGATPIASSVCTTTDLRTPCVYARNNGFGGTASDTVTLSFPATVSGITLSSATVPAFAVTVQRTLQTGLIRFVGAATSSIIAIGTAGLVGTVSPDSVIVLGPGANAFQASNGATVKVSGGAIAINSSNSDAASISGGATVSAAAIDIVGAAVISNGGSTTPAPVTGVAAIPDPFASLPALSPGTCLYSTMYSPGSGTTLQPGTYCGGISVSNGVTNVTFAAGNYIINGGGITFAGGTTATGTGVMFYLTGTNATYASVTINNGANVTLSAPSSGSYLGVLFFQNRTITSSNNATFAGGATMLLTGSLYFPTTSVSFSNGTSAQVNSTAIVSLGISFTGGANIKYDPTGLQTGLFSKAVALVQ
jgi:Flp pilus assembly protein TadG